MTNIFLIILLLNHVVMLLYKCYIIKFILIELFIINCSIILYFLDLIVLNIFKVI